MPLIKKDRKKKWFRKDNYLLIPDSDVKKISMEERVEKIPRVIFIYTDEEFDAFNAKHVQRQAFGRYTILVKGGGKKPTATEACGVVNSYLRLSDIKRNILFMDLKKPYGTATWNSILKKMVSDTNNQILFRDVITVNKRDVGDFQDILKQREYVELVNMIKNVSISDYVVVKIYFIRKILVV